MHTLGNLLSSMLWHGLGFPNVVGGLPQSEHVLTVKTGVEIRFTSVIRHDVTSLVVQALALVKRPIQYTLSRLFRYWVTACHHHEPLPVPE